MGIATISSTICSRRWRLCLHSAGVQSGLPEVLGDAPRGGGCLVPELGCSAPGPATRWPRPGWRSASTGPPRLGPPAPAPRPAPSQDRTGRLARRRYARSVILGSSRVWVSFLCCNVGWKEPPPVVYLQRERDDGLPIVTNGPGMRPAAVRAACRWQQNID